MEEAFAIVYEAALKPLDAIPILPFCVGLCAASIGLLFLLRYLFSLGAAPALGLQRELSASEAIILSWDGAYRHFVQLALAGLYRKERIALTGSGTIMKIDPPERAPGLTPEEAALYGALADGRRYGTVICDASLGRIARDAMEPTVRALTAEGLLASRSQVSLRRALHWIVFALSIVVNYAKFVLGAVRSEIYVFLWFLPLILLLFFVLANPKRLSRSGRAAMDAERVRFAQLYADAGEDRDLPRDVDPVVLAALFGIDFLGRFRFFAAFKSAGLLERPGTD